MEQIFNFEWLSYGFMKNALLAVVLIGPLFALFGTAVVSKHMAFFSDVLGHSALTGVALGVLLGMSDPFWVMFAFIVVLAVAVHVFKGITQSSVDTTLGVFFAIAVSLGILILSRGGGFNKYTSFLIGDILAISSAQLGLMAAFFALTLAYWIIFGNQLFLVSVNPSLSRSRGVNNSFIETTFVILLAMLVAISLRAVGILLINSLLVLPAAAARNLASNTRSYTAWSVAISLVSGISGLIISFYWGMASSATIIIFCACLYLASALFGKFIKNS